ncbi:MAG: Hpt domain-containing protein [Nitrospirae bacterium]|nr:Hpt domain-containing protein [Nitrospirota bacterium]
MDFEQDDEVIDTYIEETTERLDDIEQTILSIHCFNSQQCDELLNSVFRSAHSIKAGANLLKMKNIEVLAHSLENILQFFRQHKRVPNKDAITDLLYGIDEIRDLVNDIRTSNRRDITSAVDRLNALSRYLSRA